MCGENLSNFHLNFLFSKGWMPNGSMAMNPNPPASQENIDAVPVVLFGQESDQFNQTEW